MRRDDSLEKILKLGKTQGRRSEQYIDNEMVGWHHQLNAHEFEQTLGDSEGQGSLVCYSPRGRKTSDTTEGLNKKKGISSPRRAEIKCSSEERIPT